MLACVDVDYRSDGSARTAAVLFEGWSATQDTGLILHTTPPEYAERAECLPVL